LSLNAPLLYQLESLQSILVTGWDLGNENSSESHIFREVSVALVDPQNCSEQAE